jgi:DNA-binding beta-propeller fold protein YncE
LYVSHDKEVIVLDLDSGVIVGKIPGSDVHGIAVVQELGRGFISATDPGSVTIFDLKTLAVISKVRVGDDPNAIFYDRKTKRIVTIDRGSKRVSTIDPETGRVAGTVENLGGRTEARCI